MNEVRVRWDGNPTWGYRYFVEASLYCTKEELLEQIREMLKLAPDQPEKGG